MLRQTASPKPQSASLVLLVYSPLKKGRGGAAGHFNVEMVTISASMLSSLLLLYSYHQFVSNRESHASV